MTEHPIRLRNTAERSKEPRPFVPRDWRDPAIPEADRRVRVYVCGPTVYDRAHIGNARPVVVFDVLFRLLRHVYGPDRVAYVRNITDVEDKIIARAAEAGRPIDEITAETTAWFHDDMAALGALPPTREPRATEHVPGMVAMIEALAAKGHAYAAEGHVLFRVASWREEYGRLSGRSVDELLAGARVEVAPYKEDPMDFVLWKPSAPDEPGWESPWGRGRPGWHIECSAMAKAHLGETFDIHGGGIDLVFPHHENERAQSCCANGTDALAEIWMHNGYLMVEGRKMSKSLGNFITVKDLRDRGVPGAVIRYVLLKTHYRQPLDWTEEAVEEGMAVYNRWLRLTDRARRAAVAPSETPDQGVIDALCDDLNTKAALDRVSALAAGLGADTDRERLAAVLGTLRFLGFDPNAERRAEIAGAVQEAADAADLLDRLAERIHEARMARDYATADALRAGMEAAGVEVRSTKTETVWSRTAGFDPAKLADLEALT